MCRPVGSRARGKLAHGVQCERAAIGNKAPMSMHPADSALADQHDQHQQENRANHRLNDVCHQAATHADTQFRQQPTGYECAQYTHDEIDEQAIYQCVAKGLSVFHEDIDNGLSDYADQSFE